MSYAIQGAEMTSYKSRLNLPKTDFPMRGELAKSEPSRLQKWEHDQLYQKILASKSANKMFLLHDGPPYANGTIHLGHALNKTIKDIIVKSKALSGYYAPYIPGWDCHGLPIELKVEQLLNTVADRTNPLAFQRACREYAAEQMMLQKNDFKRLGVLGDWDNPYSTMDASVEAETVRILSLFVDQGYIVRGNKPVNWCINCSSSLAEAEVEYKDIISKSVYVKFKALNPREMLSAFNVATGGENNLYVVIWTTTIWTLPANRAVALHPDIQYSLVAFEKATLIIASSKVEEVMQKAGITDYQVLGHCQGNALEGQPLAHPIYDFEVPIILGDHVTLETGTGAVHTAPGHGQDDYLLGRQYGLEIASPVTNDGKFVSDMELLAGKSLAEAKDILLDVMRSNHSLLLLEDHAHSYPHCWRHKTPIIFRATPQWFLSLSFNDLNQCIDEAISATQWIPHWGGERLRIMSNNRPDWCISRQRTWGVPMCFFVHKETQELHPQTPEIMRKVALEINKHGIEAWWTLDKKAFLTEDAESYEKAFDVLDVWFESGCTSMSVVDKRPELHHHIPDLYMEGTDQYRGWLMSSMVLSCALRKQAPYKQVLTHGFTVDTKGHKMSKSMGNGIEPADIISKYGADILRLWVASTEYTREMTLSEPILASISDMYRRIRNTGRYLLSNLYDFNPEVDLVPKDALLPLDKWAIDAAYQIQKAILKDYEKYHFHKILKNIIYFCSIQMGSFYFEIIKDRQYTMPVNSLGRRSSQTALYHILEAFVRWIAPILSFTADETWGYMPGERTQYVFTEEWYTGLFPLSQDDVLNADFWQSILQMRTDINKMIETGRDEKKFTSSMQVEVAIFIKPGRAPKLLLVKEELHFIFLTAQVSVLEVDTFPEDAVEGETKDYAFRVSPTLSKKCDRCWQHRPDVGTNPSYDNLCLRCVTNVSGESEIRFYA